MNTKELIFEISELPTEERAKIAEWLLKTLNPVDPDIEQAWINEAQHRLKQFREGNTDSIPGDEVIKDIRKRLAE